MGCNRVGRLRPRNIWCEARGPPNRAPLARTSSLRVCAKGRGVPGRGRPHKTLVGPVGGRPDGGHPGGSRRPVTTKKYFVRGPWAPKPGSPRAHLKHPGVRQRGRRAGAMAPPKNACRSGWGGAPVAATQVARVGRLRPRNIWCEARGPPNRARLARTSMLGVFAIRRGVPGRGRPQNKCRTAWLGAAHPGGSRRPVTTKTYLVRGPWPPKPGAPRAHL